MSADSASDYAHLFLFHAFGYQGGLHVHLYASGEVAEGAVEFFGQFVSTLLAGLLRGFSFSHFNY